MGKKIIVAGCGHGGIAVAAILAKNGYDVTVYEKGGEGTLGYDWTDIFDPNALAVAGITMPDEDKFEYKEDMTFYTPNSEKSLKQRVPMDKREIKMERKDIYIHFINHAVDCGVKIVYDCQVNAPIMLGGRVVGISTEQGDFYGDLIIDACGMNSPVRRNLPASLMIEKDVARSEKISIFRAFYNKASDDEVTDKFKIMLLPQNILGIGWVAAEDDYTDVLIGRFEDFDMQEVERFTDVLRKDNPRLGTEIVRGGQFVEIPVRHQLSVMVADGYAAIGDSAFMTVPLIGSGIANCLRAARILADTVIADTACSFGADTLWNYQVNYYKELGSTLAPLECVKFLLFKVKPEELDYCFDSEMITEENITMSADFTGIGGLLGDIDMNDLRNKAKALCNNKELLKKLGGVVADMGKVVAACALMPKKWDKQKVAKWAQLYTKAFKQ